MHYLSELGELWTGYQLRSEDRGKFKNVHPVIQSGDILDDGIDTAGLSRENLERVRPRDFVRNGDILLRSRGASYRAVLVRDCPPETVAIAPLFVLRLTQADVLPDYLVWYINRPVVQASLAAQASGTYTRSVSIQAFSELEIIAPPIAEQRRVVEIDALIRYENVLTRRLMEQREQLAQARLDEYIQRFAHTEQTTNQTSKVKKESGGGAS